LIGFVPIV